MTIRTSSKTVTFGKPFVLDELDEVLPAGDYRVDTDEILLEGISITAYRRVSTVINLHPRPGHPGRMLTLTINPNELDTALKCDHEPAEIAAEEDTGPNAQQESPAPCQNVADRRAMERSENEGMIVHPE